MKGYFGLYGGRFVPETLVPALEELDAARLKAMKDLAFRRELKHLQETYIGPHRFISPQGSPPTSAARRYTSSAKTSPIPGRTR